MNIRELRNAQKVLEAEIYMCGVYNIGNIRVRELRAKLNDVEKSLQNQLRDLRVNKTWKAPQNGLGAH